MVAHSIVFLLKKIAPCSDALVKNATIFRKSPKKKRYFTLGSRTLSFLDRSKQYFLAFQTSTWPANGQFHLRKVRTQK